MNNLILLNKPEGITSFTAVNIVRRTLGIKKAGHTGTLDPFATGVLPILTDRATKLCDMCLKSDKAYTASVRLGVSTDTLDITGNVVEERPVNVSREELLGALEKFTTTYDQVPPMYSALKKDGVPLYKLAREGKEIERKARTVTIKQCDLLDFSDDEFRIYVVCTAGTYIRSLCSDIGRALGTGACVSALSRESCMGFSVNECVSLEDFKSDPQKYLRPCDDVCKHLRETDVSLAQGKRFCHGGELDLARIRNFSDYYDNQIVRVYSGNEFLGLGYVDEADKSLKIKCVLNSAENLEF